MLHISMRNVVRLGLAMLVAATTLALSAPKAQAESIFLVPVTGLTYQDNEGCP